MTPAVNDMQNQGMVESRRSSIQSSIFQPLSVTTPPETETQPQRVTVPKKVTRQNASGVGTNLLQKSARKSGKQVGNPKQKELSRKSTSYHAQNAGFGQKLNFNGARPIKEQDKTKSLKRNTVKPVKTDNLYQELLQKYKK